MFFYTSPVFLFTFESVIFIEKTKKRSLLIASGVGEQASNSGRNYRGLR